MPSRPDNVGRTSLVLVPIALACRGAAFAVPVVVALYFGVDAVADAWYWALAFPTFCLVLASAALGTAAAPVLARVRVERPDDLPTVLGGLVLWAGLVALVAGAAIAAASPLALEHWTRFEPSTRDLAAAFLWELVPFMGLVAVGAVLRVAVEVHGRFRAVATTPLLKASVVIALTMGLLPVLGVHVLPLAMVGGAAVEVAWFGLQLRLAGVVPRPSLVVDAAVRSVAGDLAPVLGGELFVALNIVVDKGFAGALPEGSLATLEYADRVRVIPQTLLESTLVMVSFATWANLRAEGRLDLARRGMDQALRWTLALSAPVLAGLFIGRKVLVGLLFEHGAFTSSDTAETADVLAWYLPGVLPLLLGMLAAKAHVVEHRLRLVLVLGVVSLGLNAGLDLLLVGPMGTRGIALATTLDMVVVPCAYLFALRHSVSFDFFSWGPALLVAATSAALAAFVELGPGVPGGLLDGVLWGSAASCLALLRVGWGITKPHLQK